MNTMIKRIKRILRNTLSLFLISMVCLVVIALMIFPVLWFISTNDPNPIVAIFILIWVIFCIMFTISIIKEIC